MGEADHNVSPKPWLNWGISEEEFRQYMDAKAERDKRVPKVGTIAPDFEAEKLSPEGKRTGEMFQLSSARGRPIGLVLGSYT
jgi:hypothetical protein